MDKKELDICQKCERYWLDFPMPLDLYVSHCEIADSKGLDMDKAVPYPCLECPFKSFKPKKEYEIK